MTETPYPNDDYRAEIDGIINRLATLEEQSLICVSGCMAIIMRSKIDQFKTGIDDIEQFVNPAVVKLILEASDQSLYCCHAQYPFEGGLELEPFPSLKPLEMEWDGGLPGISKTRESYYFHSLCESLGRNLLLLDPADDLPPDPVGQLYDFFNSMISANEYFYELGVPTSPLGNFAPIKALLDSLLEFWENFSIQGYETFRDVEEHFRRAVGQKWDCIFEKGQE